MALYAEICSIYFIACSSKTFIDISETKTCFCHAQTGAKATYSSQQHGKAWYMGVLHVSVIFQCKENNGPCLHLFIFWVKDTLKTFFVCFFIQQRWLKKTNNHSLSRLNSKSRRFRCLFSTSRFGFLSLFDLRQFKWENKVRDINKAMNEW